MGGLSALEYLVTEGAKTDDAADTTVDGIILCGALIQVAPEVLPPKVDGCCVHYVFGVKYVGIHFVSEDIH